jgi:hypothetical protein
VDGAVNAGAPYRPEASAPSGVVVELAGKPSVAALLWVLLPMGLFAILVPVLLAISDPPGTGPVVVAFLVTLVLAGVVLALVARKRPVEYRLVVDPRGVFLTRPSGEVLGRVGTAPLTVSPGHWETGSRSGTQRNQCAAIGGEITIGTYGYGFGPYRAPVPTVAQPRFTLRAPDWTVLVQALPELASIQ